MDSEVLRHDSLSRIDALYSSGDITAPSNLHAGMAHFHHRKRREEVTWIHGASKELKRMIQAKLR